MATFSFLFYSKELDYELMDYTTWIMFITKNFIY